MTLHIIFFVHVILNSTLEKTFILRTWLSRSIPFARHGLQPARNASEDRKEQILKAFKGSENRVQSESSRGYTTLTTYLLQLLL